MSINQNNYQLQLHTKTIIDKYVTTRAVPNIGFTIPQNTLKYSTECKILLGRIKYTVQP